MKFVELWQDRLGDCSDVEELARVMVTACKKCVFTGKHLDCENCPIDATYTYQKEAITAYQEAQQEILRKQAERWDVYVPYTRTGAYAKFS